MTVIVTDPQWWLCWACCLSHPSEVGKAVPYCRPLALTPQVFTSYIDLLYPTEDRNDRLRDSYFFTCECRECTTKDKVSSLMGQKRVPAPSPPQPPLTCLPTQRVCQSF